MFINATSKVLNDMANPILDDINCKQRVKIHGK